MQISNISSSVSPARISNIQTTSDQSQIISKPQQLSQDETKLQQADTGTGNNINIISKPELMVAQTTSEASEEKSSGAYSVEISQEGMRLNSLNSSDVASLSEKKSAAPPKNGTSSSAGNSESTSSDSLSQYSESQLKSMLGSGKITQSEYNLEIANRATDDQDTESFNPNSALNATSETARDSQEQQETEKRNSKTSTYVNAAIE